MDREDVVTLGGSMAIITVSRGTYRGGVQFAEELARQLGYDYLGREELSDLASDAGIPVGKLQMALVKPPSIQQHLGPLRDMYLAFVTDQLITRIHKSRNIVYHGHAGHMLLSTIPNILRVRVVADLEYRVKGVQERLGLTRGKALRYIQDVDRDRERWVRFLYDIEIDDPQCFDFTINLSQMHVFNAAAGLIRMADIPEFQTTPAMERSLDDLQLASRARYMLARDKRTEVAELEVVADSGTVQVRLSPLYAETASVVPDVLSGLEGCSNVKCTLAQGSIVWLQDRFEEAPPLCPYMARMARQWDASIELMRSVPTTKDESGAVRIDERVELLERNETGGIQEDAGSMAEDAVEDISQAHTKDELQRQQCVSSISTVYGGIDEIVSAIGKRDHCNLVVIGELRLAGSEAGQKRMYEQLRGRIADNLGLPVLSTGEIESQAKVSVKNWLVVGLQLLIVALVVGLVMHFQSSIISLFTDEGYTSIRWLVIVCIMGFVPTFAYLYGTSTGTLFKVLKMK